MPANLPPQYSKAEHELRSLTSPAERLEKLREMYRLIPKHKGTERLQAELKQKISRAREEAEAGGRQARRGGVSYRVPHEGAGQTVLLGPPNAGKSALLAALTHAHPEVAAYPFTTRVPQPGMMPWRDVQVQLVDLPPITADVMEPWLPSIVRSADAAWLVVDLADDDTLDATQAVIDRLAAVHTELVGTLPFDQDNEAIQHVRTLVVANKRDAPDASDRLELVRDGFGPRFPIVAVSAATGEGLESLAEQAYDLLQVIRIFTKVPGKPVDRTHPYTLPIGSTVEDLARAVHRDLADRLKFARVWGTGVFDGQTVKRDHALHDGDLVELHE
jgi:ribosome-interacting GTPase 1